MRLIPLLSIICFALVAFGIVRWTQGKRRGRKKEGDARNRLEFKDLPGMTSPQERNFVREYAARDVRGEGAIVDLGCWLGSFTLPLAICLRENSRISAHKACIHAYDLFVWQDYMNGSVAATRWAGRYKEGANFRDAFVEQIAPVADLVTVHAGNLNNEVWEPAKPIEYLLIDVMKSWEPVNSVLGNFFPALRPGLSLVHYQDFVHYFTPWIHLIMYRFRRYFETLTYIPHGSYVFKYRELIPRELLEKCYDFGDFSTEEAAAAFEYSLSLIPEAARTNVFAVRIMLQIHRGDKTSARSELERLRTAGVPLEKELAVVSKLLEN